MLCGISTPLRGAVAPLEALPQAVWTPHPDICAGFPPRVST